MSLVGAAALAACGPRDDEQKIPSGAQWDPAPTVLLVTVDSLNVRLLMDNDWGWDTAPNLHAFFDESVLFPHTLAPRSMTRPSLSSLLTGSYPRDHRVRGNHGSPVRVTLQERFQANGYHTFGYSANQCPLIDMGIDERVCTWEQEDDEEEAEDSYQERDEQLVDELLDSLAVVDSEEQIFVWLHLNHVHRPFELVREYYDEFHPERYLGDLDPSDEQQMEEITFGEREYSEADRRHVEAAYASQIRDSDRRIQSVLQLLQDLDRYEDAVVVFGIDHGEELAEHNAYFWHGCSPYRSVLGVAYAFRAPRRVPEPGVNEGWISHVDIAPTIVGLADAFAFAGTSVGQSLVPYLVNGGEPTAPVFFERGINTGGVVADNYKYHLSADPTFSSCDPYKSVAGADYLGEEEELYDLVADPEELNNLASEQTELRDELKTQTCAWVRSRSWMSTARVDDNELVGLCRDWAGD